jgi:lipopolysaccharide assembly protein B
MTFEAFGLLPWLLLGALVCFGAGWLAARSDVKQIVSESREMPQAYFRGLNFLLNEEQDKAIEAIIEVTKSNPETAELQFALGSLFRRKGQTDRAIRIHQSLSERADIRGEDRVSALYELALDYQKAGLLDYAEKILDDLIAANAGSQIQRVAIGRLLLDVCVQERNWSRAIGGAKLLDVETAKQAPTGAKLTDHRSEIAQFYCEIAIEKNQEADVSALAEANAALDAALAENAHCVRANMLKREWYAARGDHENAIAAWRAIEGQDSAYLGLSAVAALKSYVALNREAEGVEVLRRMHQQYPALDLLDALFTSTLAREGSASAYALVRDDLKMNPTLIGLDKLLQAHIMEADQIYHEDLTLVKNILYSYSSKLSHFLCGTCGFKAKQYYWHCPACGGWESFPPRRTAEIEAAQRHLVQSKIEGRIVHEQ